MDGGLFGNDSIPDAVRVPARIRHIGIMYCTDEQGRINITMPCGHQYSYDQISLPHCDTPCDCGDPDHWVVKFEARA